MLALSFSPMKEATTHLFTLPTFDQFFLLKANIVSFSTFSIDGHSNPDFFDSEEEVPPCLPWSKFRPFCYDIIKGKRPPISFQITLFLDQQTASILFSEPDLSLNQNISGYTVRFQYQEHQLLLITGTIFSSFSMDKESERLFDECLLHFLKQLSISYSLPI